MNICILNGNQDKTNTGFEIYLADLAHVLESMNHHVTHMVLRDMDIQYCTGCFGCWVKTPGRCVSVDDSVHTCRAIIQSDFTLWASPIRMGFPSALLKKVVDKSIPLIHPYFVVDQGEAHHRARYESYPRLGLLLEKDQDTDQEDIRIIHDIFSRTAINMKSHLAFCALTDQPVESTADLIMTLKETNSFINSYPTTTHGVQITPPSRLTIFNGSPRGAKGNTPLMLQKFLDGFSSIPGHTYEIFHLNHLRQSERFIEAFAQAESVLLGFPLYTDAMPGIVKAFIEQLEPMRQNNIHPPIGFLVQSGFPESAHSRHVEAYLQKLASRLGSPYLGTIVKGGCEGIRLMPENMNHKLFECLYNLGRDFATSGYLNADLLQTLAKPERYPSYLVPMFKLLTKTSLLSFYWDGQLKENGVYDQRFAQPYVTSHGIT